MHLYAQHGHGKGDKIERGLTQHVLSGVILSPRDLAPAKMVKFVGELRKIQADATLLFDPQVYGTAARHPARLGRLPAYPYFPPSGSPDQIASAVLDYQLGLGLDRLISPGWLQTSLNSSAVDAVMASASSSIEVWSAMTDAPPLLVSVVLDETPLQDQNAVDNLLNDLTRLDVHGFYVIVRRNDSTYPAKFEVEAATNLMYLVYALAERNRFEVVCGYSDIVGLLLHSVGATATASGWYSNLRQFSLRRFEESGPSAPARPRYTSRPLLNSVLVLPELQTAYTQGAIPVVLSQTPFDSVFSTGSPGNAVWPAPTSCLHHWTVMTDLVARFSSRGSVAGNLDALEAALQQSSALYESLRRLGVLFQVASGPRDCRLHLDVVRRFRDMVRV